MGIDYSYHCTAIANVRELGTIYGKRVVLCDLQFEDEHKHDLAPVTNAMVVVGKEANFVENPEDVLPDTATDAEWSEWEQKCDDYPPPSYGFYNAEHVAQLLSV